MICRVCFMILGSLVPQGTESGIESLSWNECQAVQKALALLAGVQLFNWNPFRGIMRGT